MNSEKPLFRNPDAPVADRVADLVARMTLEEKISQVQHIAVGIDRLGILPYNWWNEGLHGVSRAGIATVFPQAIGLAATFDEQLMFEITTVVSDEARAKHHEAQRRGDYDYYKGLTYWSPNINLFRDPRWGRGQETYGEDPFLMARMGVAYVKGMQGDDPKHLKLVATPKHFAVHSGPEAKRHEFNAVASKKDMAESYLPHFEATVKEGNAASIMAAYNRTNGEPCCGSKPLLISLLRDDWGFKGFVVSDCGGVEDFHQHHKITLTPAESAGLALRNGCDLCCGEVYAHLGEAIEQGFVGESHLDLSVSRLMEARIRLGMFDPPERVAYASIPFDVVDCEPHRELSRVAARRSMVLLKNAGNMLPLPKELRAIAVVGPNADAREVMYGNYHGLPSKAVTPLDAIRAKVSPQTKVYYTPGCDLLPLNKPWMGHDKRGFAEALAYAERSDVVIAVMGLSAALEGEQGDAYNSDAGGDRTHMDLTGHQNELLELLFATGKPVVVVLMSGSALAVNEIHSKAAAVVQAWYPGQEGGTGVADVLFGDHNPSGRLPVTFYKSMADLPPFEDYAMENRTYRFFKGEPLYPFGFGLSFTTFKYANLRTAKARIAKGEALDASVDVTNAGRRDGDEVVQVYLRDEQASTRVPLRKLVAFHRIFLKAGETRTVTLTIPARQFMIVDDQGRELHEAGTFRIFVGGSQPDARSKALGAAAWAEATVEMA